jgi:hypothetical protein
MTVTEQTRFMLRVRCSWCGTLGWRRDATLVCTGCNETIGDPCDIDRVMAIARRRGVRVTDRPLAQDEPPVPAGTVRVRKRIESVIPIDLDIEVRWETVLDTRAFVLSEGSAVQGTQNDGNRDEG